MESVSQLISYVCRYLFTEFQGTNPDVTILHLFKTNKCYRSLWLPYNLPDCGFTCSQTDVERTIMVPAWTSDSVIPETKHGCPNPFYYAFIPCMHPQPHYFGRSTILWHLAMWRMQMIPTYLRDASNRTRSGLVFYVLALQSIPNYRDPVNGSTNRYGPSP